VWLFELRAASANAEDCLVRTEVRRERVGLLVAGARGGRINQMGHGYREGEKVCRGAGGVGVEYIRVQCVSEGCMGVLWSVGCLERDRGDVATLGDCPQAKGGAAHGCILV
jgi:hypothetical protein